jgi:serine protease Do
MKSIFKVIQSLVLVFFCIGILNFHQPKAHAASDIFTIRENKLSINEGASAKLTLISNSKLIKKTIWISSNKSIVTVDQTGRLKGLKKGNAIITAYIPNTKLKSTSNITVTPKAPTAYSSQDIYKMINPSVVYIELYNKFNQQVSTGSGFILSKDGLIATNLHVISDVSGGKYVKIRLANGKIYQTSKVVAASSKYDLSVLKIDGVNDMQPVKLGDSSKIVAGQKVYALGSPLGYQNTITEGIISNTSISVHGINLIQTSAPISHGNSGGPLVDSFGNVVGMMESSFVEGQNMNLAIPINFVKSIDKTNNYSLIYINEVIYPPLAGKGTIKEEEPNDTEDNADELIYLENTILGNIESIEDMDTYSIYLTDYKTISIVGSTEDPNYSKYLGIALCDDNGNIVAKSTHEYSNDTGKYESKINYNLKPGIYYVVCYGNTNSDATLDWNKNNYKVQVDFK